MIILITGAEGQLARELVDTFKEKENVLFSYNKQQLDITDRNQIKEVLQLIKPDLIINAAAFTKVDLCELEVDKAYDINSLGPYYLASEAKKVNSKLFHISTDYVFSGDQLIPYKESDPTFPRTVYGKSKRIGEELSFAIYNDITIIRTSWLYGHGGHNFVNTMKKLAEDSREIRVVCDQFGCPTYTRDLGMAIKKLITCPTGIYHVSNSGSCSWFEFAREILKLLKMEAKILPISSEEYSFKTPRPRYSILSYEKLKETGINVRHWKEGLRDYLQKEFGINEN